MKKKSILKIVGGFDDGGVYTCEYNFISKLKQRGFVVDLVIVGKGDRFHDYKEIADSFILLDNLNSTLSGGVVKIIKEILKIKRYGSANYRKISLQLTKPYYAVLYRRPMYMYLAARLSKAYQCRSYWHMPNIVTNTLARLFYTFFLWWNKTIAIANSNFTRRTLGRICKYVVYPGYAKSRVVPTLETYRSELNIPIDAPVYGVAGRICYDKAQDVVIEAFCKSQILNNSGHLVIAGGYDVSDDFFLKIKKTAFPYIGKNIHFLGRIDDLPKFYSTIDVAINGRRNAEAFGISVAEALGAMKPVIAYRLGGPSEMIKEGVNGWLVEKPTVESFRDVLELSFGHRGNWLEMGTPEAKLAELSVEHNVEKLIGILQENYVFK